MSLSGNIVSPIPLYFESLGEIHVSEEKLIIYITLDNGKNTTIKDSKYEL